MASAFMGLIGLVITVFGLWMPWILPNSMIIKMGISETVAIYATLWRAGYIWLLISSACGAISWPLDVLVKTWEIRLASRPAKTDLSKYFWIGLWLIPFSIAASILTWIFALAAQGSNQAAQFRGQALITILIAVVALVISVIGSGWAADEATKRVRG